MCSLNLSFDSSSPAKAATKVFSLKTSNEDNRSLTIGNC